MAFPPAALTTNRTNATPQNNTHPADHNAIAAAINDTVVAVQAQQAVTTVQGVDATGSMNLAAGGTFSLTFSALSNANWATGVPFTAPAGTFGRFLFTLNVGRASNVDPGRLIIATPFGNFENPFSGLRGCVMGECQMFPGSTVQCQLTTPVTQGGPLVHTYRFEIVRVSG